MRYFFDQTWSNIRESWGVVLQAIAMMSIAFFLFGAFAALSIQVESVLKRWEFEAPIIAYLTDDLSEIQLLSLQQKIRDWPEVKSVRLVTSQQAMQRLRKAMGREQHLFQGIDGNLLPGSIEIDVAVQMRSEQQLNLLRQKMERIQGIAEIDVGQQWFAPLWELVKWVRAILWGGGGLLLICACLIAAGTIRMALFVHRDEIEIMRLLGATERFVRIPFFLEGCFKGLLAALLALFLLFALFVAISFHYDDAFYRFTALHLRFFSPLQCGLLLLGGMLTGFCGSWLALITTPTQRIL
jgi:cell division transport system permease protein